MDIEKCRIGMKVCTKEGYIGTVVGMQRKELVIVSFGPRSLPYQAGELSPASDPCEGCQMQDDRDFWKTTALQYQEQAHYWMQEWVDREMKPLAEVAKCYKQVGPEALLLSAEARRVVEYIDFTEGHTDSIYMSHIMDGLDRMMSETEILDAVIEARDAGKIQLIDGKYSIVRD